MPDSPQVVVDRLYIIGVGLIGGSLALSLKQNQDRSPFCREIIGLGRNEKNLQRAVELGVIDHYSTDWSSIQKANMILLSIPLNAYDEVFRNIKPYVSEHCVLTDAGSAKACVLLSAKNAFGHIPANLVPAHPIAGNEKSGVDASITGLYENRKVILTPHDSIDSKALSLVRRMWQCCGASVEEMEVEHHDRILAMTSHLPHMLAFGLVDSLAQNSDVDEIFRYAAGGFRDFTRIASSDPVMWRDICLHNRQAILEALSNYQTDLQDIQTAITNGDAETLKTIFERAKTARDQFSG